MQEIKAFLKIIRKKAPHFNIKKIESVLKFAADAHAEQFRESGEAYITHPIAVAEILLEINMDQDCISAAILHDTVEDTGITLEDVEIEFGKNIAKLVDGVTKLDKIKFQPDHIRQAENFRKLFMAMSEDIRIILIKLADRLHNIRTLSHVSDEKKQRIALETLELYAPIAERIGIQKIKNELQDTCFGILYPEERESIINRLEFLRKDGGYVVDRIETHLRQTIKDVGIKATIYGREKTPCSIWQKMQQKNISFEQLSDIIAFRIIVEDVIDCYTVLGVIHAAYHMVPGSFKDYISTPKDNGYMSLHTVVVGPEKQRIEIQIRTKDMNEVNELGMAAHWSYKQNAGVPVEIKQLRWFREMIDVVAHSNSEELLEHTKMEIYDDQVFCFTPKGYLVPLPKGATPVDFAYALHSDIGHSCVGAKINGRVAPLRAKLENGDQVEIIRGGDPSPSPSWDKFVVTAKAKSEIKKFIRQKQKHQYIILGKAIMEKFLLDEEYIQDNSEMDNILGEYLKPFHKKNLDDLYMAIGEGTTGLNDIKKILANTIKKSGLSFKKSFSFFGFRKNKSSENSISIKGLIPGMAVTYATCCTPLPGDKIVGIQHAGKGITIHTADCEMLENYASSPEIWFDVAWDTEKANEVHIGRVKLILSHEPGSLATVTQILSKNNININNLKVISRSKDFFEVIVDVEVAGVNQLKNLIASLRSKTCVHSAERHRIV